MEPPQACDDLPKMTYCKLTINGNSPGKALTPPTMNELPSLGAATEAATKVANNNKNFILKYLQKYN